MKMIGSQDFRAISPKINKNEALKNEDLVIFSSKGKTKIMEFIQTITVSTKSNLKPQRHETPLNSTSRKTPLVI